MPIFTRSVCLCAVFESSLGCNPTSALSGSRPLPEPNAVSSSLLCYRVFMIKLSS